MKAKGKDRGLAYSSSCIFLETQLNNNGDLGLEREGAGSSATIFKRGNCVECGTKSSRCENSNRCHQKEVPETVELVDGRSCVFMETELKIKGKLGSRRCSPMPMCGARCKKRKWVEYDSKGPKSKNIDIHHQKEVSETVKLADRKSSVFLEPELKIKGELGLDRRNAMYGARWEVGKLVEYDGKSHKNINTSQQEVPETVELQYVDYIYGHRGKFPDYCIQEEGNDCVVTPDHDDGGGKDDDPQYMTFLASTVREGASYMTTLEENGSPLFIHYEKEDMCGDESDYVCRRRVKTIKKGHDDYGRGNDDDPPYMTFLANTVQKDASYMTKLEENGLPLFIHYEKEDGCGDEPDDVCRRRVKNIEKGQYAREKAFGTVSGKYKVERANGLKMVLEKNKDVSVVVDNEIFEPPYTVSAGHGPVPKSHYEYDINSGSHKEGSTQNRRNNGSNNGRSTQNWRISGKDREEENIDEDYLVLYQNMTCKNYAVKTSFSGNQHMECSCNHSEGVEAIPNNYAVVCKERSPDISPGNQHVEYDLKDWEEESIDDDYLVLLQSMTCENYVIKASSGGNQLVEYGYNPYEDVKVIQNNYAMVCKERSPDLFIPSKEYLSLDETCKLLGESMQSPFRQEIINILERPYNQSEYEKLLEDVKVRKPIEKNLELRNGRDMLYPTKKIGKSYLDHYKDLKKRLKEVRSDKHKMLNILRGFFFWLQNVTQVGVFKPWDDPECLAIVPGSC